MTLAQRPAPGLPSQWRRCLAIMRERKLVMIGVFVASMAASLAWIMWQTPIYRATACLQFDTESTKVLDFQDRRSGEVSDDKFATTLNTQMRVIRSWTLCNQTAKALALESNKDFMKGVQPDADVASVLQACLNVQPIRGSRLVEVQAEHPSPQLAARLADGIAQQYITQNAQQLMAASLDSVRWLGQQALKELNGALAKAQTDRLNAETDWTQVQALRDAGLKPEEIPAIVTSAEVSTLRLQARQKQVAIAVLERRYRPEHPVLIVAQTELAGITVKLTQASDEAMQQIRAKFLTAKAHEESLQQAMQAEAKKALTSDHQKLDPDRTAGQPAAYNIRLLDPVRTPVKPFKPNVKYILVFGILLGIFGSVGLALLLDALDDRVRSYADVESLQLPMLSGVPPMKVPDGRELQTIPNSAYVDSFRGLRASIGMKPEAKDAKTLMVTSTTSDEGKTMVAANLSISYAIQGERTLLIDCDLHCPGQGKIFKTQPDKGLEKFLAGDLPFREIIQSTDVQNLDVITIGPVKPNGADLLASRLLPDLLKEADRAYDRVVIDSPPVMAGSGPLILLPHVKGVVFVVGSGKTHREDVEQAMQKLRDRGAPLVGVVINNVNGAEHKEADSQAGNGRRPRETDPVRPSAG